MRILLVEDEPKIAQSLGLPKIDGLSVLKRWRAVSRVMPVLILTARGAWMERVEGIDAGADDYLVKPFQIEENRGGTMFVMPSFGEDKNIMCYLDDIYTYSSFARFR